MTPTEFYAKNIPFNPRVSTCINGHAYDENNTRYVIHEDSSASRYCVECRKLYKMWTREVEKIAEKAKLEAQRTGSQHAYA